MTTTGRTTVVRAPNHLGDLVLALPALAAADGDVVVPPGLAPLLSIARLAGRIIPLDGFAATARTLRASRYANGILLPPSFSSALLFALGGVKARRGTTTDGRHLLLTQRVAPASLEGLHRAVRYMVLAGGPPRGVTPKLDLDAELLRRGRAFVGKGVIVGVFPGGNAPSRRWVPDRFAELVRRLLRRGMRVVVFGGSAERDLTATVVGQSGATDAGGRTDLPLLAAALAECTVLVSNDTGPMHLAAAVGTPTVSLWGAGDPQVTGPLGIGNRLIRHPELPCVPCAKNKCPRAGRGTFLPSAQLECLSLITVDDVERAVLAALAVVGTPPLAPHDL